MPYHYHRMGRQAFKSPDKCLDRVNPDLIISFPDFGTEQENRKFVF